MTATRACVCGHVKGLHHEGGPVRDEFTATETIWCVGNRGDGCICDGWQLPARPGERLVFGRHRVPYEAAVTAPAWARGEQESEQ